jgi:hypothetical protein
MHLFSEIHFHFPHSQLLQFLVKHPVLLAQGREGAKDGRALQTKNPKKQSTKRRSTFAATSLQ